MDEVPIVGQDENWLFKKFLGQYDAPAYLRRARQVEDAFAALLDACRAKRAELLELVAVRLGTLRALVAGDWRALASLLADDTQVSVLEQLAAELKPQLRVPVEPTSSPRRLRLALHELCESLNRFNRRWLDYLDRLDLSSINELRDKYNRYYVLEKEFAVRSARVARQGFHPLSPLTLAEIREMLPPLTPPRMK
jgi:hypothetical protein